MGHAAYRVLIRRGERFDVIATLFPERLRFCLNVNCAHERMALLMNEYEAATSAFIAATHEEGTILDIGANIGLVALPLAAKIKKAKGTKEKVYAVEALPANFASLAFNIRENGLADYIVPLNYALGDEDGRTVHIQVEGDQEDRTGTANILPEDREFHRIPLILRSVDGLASDGVFARPVGSIKIDTDGYDFHILRGARLILQEDRPLVFAELSRHCLGWHDVRIDDVVSFAESLGYELWPKRADSFKFVEWRPGYPFEIDALLVPKEKRDKFSHLLVEPAAR